MTNITGFVRSLISSQSRNVELIRYIIVGGIATLSQYGFYVMLVRLAGMSTILSAPVSYGLSFCVNFILSNYFTFHTRPNAKKAFSFAASHLINLGLQTMLVAPFANIVGNIYALLPAMAICVPVNYFLVRFALTDRRFQGTRETME